MRNIFHNSEHQIKFQKDGAIILDFLEGQEIEEMKELVSKLAASAQDTGFNKDSSYKLSFFRDSPDYRKKVFNEVGDFFQLKVDRIIKGFKPLIINVFDKEPGKGEVPVHQNWTFVDESEFFSISVWIPLIDATRKNGTLEVVKGSHGVLTPYRSPTIPWVFQDLFQPLRDKYLEPLEVKLGQCGVIDDSILHWSSDNDSDQVRTAIQLIMIPEEAKAIHYYWDKEQKPNQLEIFEVSPEFYTSFEMHQKPAGVPSLGFVNFTYQNLTEQQLVEIIATNNPEILEKI